MDSKEIVKYDVTDAAIAEMKEMYMGLVITDIDDKEQYDAVHRAHMTVRGKRIEVDKKRKELKADALEWGRKVQAEANRIFALIEPIENHLKAEKQKVQDEKDRIERERVAKIEEKIDHLKKFRIYDPRLTSIDEIKKVIKSVEEWKIEPEEYFEFTTEANELKSEILIANSKILEMRENLDKEEAERKAEAKRQAKIAAEQAEIQRKLDEQQAKIDEQNRKIQAEKDAIEAEKRKAEEAKRIEAAKKEAAEQARLAEIERQKREAQEKAEVEKRRKEEEIRQEMLRPDKEKLVAFAQFLNEGITYPNVENQKADDLLQWAHSKIIEISDTILDKSEKI